MGSVYSGYPNGRIGQLYGDFSARENVISKIREKHNIIDYKGLLKIGIQASAGTEIIINGQNIRIGSTGIYELDYTILIKELWFKTDVTSVLIDYVY